MRGVVVADGGGIDIDGGFTGLAEREDAALERKDAARARPVLGVRWWVATCLAETGGGR